jgi:hypothetical protein
MGIRRILISITSNIYKQIESSNKGENPFLMPKGENKDFDYLCKNYLGLPDKTPVYCFVSSSIIDPLILLKGRESRPPGDTCKMFYKIKIEGRMCIYFYWNGIVPEGIDILGKRQIIEEHTYYFEDNIGLATGIPDYRMVLIDKIKKAPRKESFSMNV